MLPGNLHKCCLLKDAAPRTDDNDIAAWNGNPSFQSVAWPRKIECSHPVLTTRSKRTILSLLTTRSHTRWHILSPSRKDVMIMRTTILLCRLLLGLIFRRRLQRLPRYFRTAADLSDESASDGVFARVFIGLGQNGGDRLRTGLASEFFRAFITGHSGPGCRQYFDVSPVRRSFAASFGNHRLCSAMLPALGVSRSLQEPASAKSFPEIIPYFDPCRNICLL